MNPSVVSYTMWRLRDSQMLQDKALFAVNGYSIDKNCNAVLGHL